MPMDAALRAFYESLKRSSARELLTDLPRVPTSKLTLDLPDVDGARVNELLDEEERLFARIEEIRMELADHLCLRRSYVRGRQLAFLRSDAAILLAARYLLANG